MFYLIGKFLTKDVIYRVIDTEDFVTTDISEEDLKECIRQGDYIEYLDVVDDKLVSTRFSILSKIGIIGSETQVYTIIGRGKNYYMLSDQEGNTLECNSNELKLLSKNIEIVNKTNTTNKKSSKTDEKSNLQLIIFGIKTEKIKAQILIKPDRIRYLTFEFEGVTYELQLKNCAYKSEKREYYHAFIESYEADNNLMDIMCYDWRTDSYPHLTVIVEKIISRNEYSKAIMILNCERSSVYNMRNKKQKEGVFNISGLHVTKEIIVQEYTININFNESKVEYYDYVVE